MRSSPLLRRPHRIVALACLLAAAGGTSASAAAVVQPSSHAQSGAGAGGAGIRAQAPSQTALSQALSQSTGLSPSQVSTQDLCPPASQGVARCEARALVLRSSGLRVRPLLQGRPGRSLFVPAAASGQSVPAESPPLPDSPAYLRQAYDLSWLSQTGGVGNTIAIVDAYDDPTAESDLGVYRSEYGLPPCGAQGGCFQKVNETGARSSLPALPPPERGGWRGEISLDLDAVSAVCPNCSIRLIEANSDSTADLTVAMNTAVGLHADQVSASFGAESPLTGFNQSDATVVAATGDDGYLPPSQVNYPAALPDVTAAGGTTLAAATGGQGGRGFSESAWATSVHGEAGVGCTLETKPSYQHDTGCTHRAYADVSADADPATGIAVYDNGRWLEYGGTSLATPVIAAYYAITGIDATTPQWAYDSSSLLNDPFSGSVGNCAAAIAYICNADTGYDGPTGVGSISGAVVAGAPGIGGPTVATSDAGTNTYATSVGQGSAALTAGVYPNGLDTTYWWQYGPTADYGHYTSAVDIGQGTAPMPLSSILSGLLPLTTYHFRLVAQNSAGTAYGYDYTLRTFPGAPSQATSGSTTSGGSALSGSGAGAGHSGKTSPPRIVSVPTLKANSTPQVGARVKVSGGRYSDASATAVQLWRCAPRCAPIGRPSAATSYKLGAADAGAFLRARETVSGPGGSSSVWAKGLLGPVRGPHAAFAVMHPGAPATLRAPYGVMLVRAAEKVSRSGASVSARVTVTRARGARGTLLAWACAVGNSALRSCTSVRKLRGSRVSLTIHASKSDLVELIALSR